MAPHCASLCSSIVIKLNACWKEWQWSVCASTPHQNHHGLSVQSCRVLEGIIVRVASRYSKSYFTSRWCWKKCTCAIQELKATLLPRSILPLASYSALTSVSSSWHSQIVHTILNGTKALTAIYSLFQLSFQCVTHYSEWEWVQWLSIIWMPYSWQCCKSL